jgi:pilus assembly protein Flp/PilA
MINLINHGMLRLMAAVQARKLQAEEDGQTLVEYALIIVVISLAAILTMTALGTEISSVFTDIKDKLAARP